MKKYYKLISFAYLILITVSLLIPLDFFLIKEIVPEEKQPSNNSSFLIHLVIFFFLYFFLFFAFSNKHYIFLFCITYSIIIEILQIFTTRGFQILDIIFNLCGVLISFFIILFFKNRKKLKKSKFIINFLWLNIKIIKYYLHHQS